MTRTHFVYKWKSISGLLDTHEGISVIIASQWHSRYPKTETITQLQGIGQTQNPEQCSNELYCKDGEG